MVTYKEIQENIKNKYGFTVKTCWIAHVKEMCNFPMEKASNRISKERKHPCPPDKVTIIKESFKYFGMI